MADYNDPIGLSAWMISLNTMLMLEKKGVLSHADVKEIVEQALLNLETHQAKAEPASQPVFQTSREILEALRMVISPPSALR